MNARRSGGEVVNEEVKGNQARGRECERDRIVVKDGKIFIRLKTMTNEWEKTMKREGGEPSERRS